MKIYRLQRAVFLIKNNAEKFLNGLTSNATTQPRNAFLDLHGKIIATFDQLKISDDEFLVVVGDAFVDELLKHIDRYVRLSQVSVTKTDFKTYFDLDGSFQPQADEWRIPQTTGQLILTKKELASTVSDEDFTLFRLSHDLPLQGADYQHEMLLNVDDHEYVSFTKGCFLGQEPISKVHNRSKPTWKLVVRYADETTQDERQPMTSKMVNPENGRIWGFVFVKNA